MQSIQNLASFVWPRVKGKITDSIDFYSNNSSSTFGRNAHKVMRMLGEHERENGKLTQSEKIEWVKTFTGIEPQTV